MILRGVFSVAARRVKTVLDVATVTEMLGLPDSMRIVGMYTALDPDEVHVRIEGDDVPTTRSWPHGPCNEELAAAGAVESPIVPAAYWGGARTPAERAAAAVFTALGAASACWEDLSAAGEFDSSRAAQVGRDLLVALGFEVPPGYQDREPAPPAAGASVPDSAS